ncbi:hypothetical protein Btru_067371 [Bulinus truncatus]|nr:hypothetical protein Btru_067371 [Bulinus truncatus]
MSDVEKIDCQTITEVQPAKEDVVYETSLNADKVVPEEISLLVSPAKDVIVKETVPDGGYGWFVVLGCFLSHILIGGFERSDAVYYLKFKSYYEQSSQLTSWPSALASAFRLFLGPFASALSNMYSVRLAVLVGTILMTLGQLLTAFSPSFYFLFFCQSVLQGVGSGLLYSPSIVIVGLYFDKHRGLAAGLGSAGVGVGTFCIVPFTQWLFDNYAFQGAFLLLAGIAFNGMIVAMLFRPLSLHNRWTKKNWLSRNQPTEDNNQIIKADKSVNCQEAEVLTISLSESTLSKALRHRKSKHWLHSTIVLCCPTESKKSNFDKKQIFNVSLLLDPSFVMFCISLMLFTASFKAAFTFIPALVKSKGISETDAALVLSITGIFDTAGRIVAGLIFDLRKIKFLRPLLFNSFIFAIAGVSFVLPSLKSFASFCTLCSIYGILTGAYISQKSVVIVDILGIENLSTSFGLLICFQAVGICAGPPLSGAFHDIFGTFDEAFYLGGGFMIVAGFLMIISNILLRAKTNKLKSDGTIIVIEK